MSTSVTNIQNRLHSGEYGVNIVAFSNEIATPTDPLDLEHSTFTRLSDINTSLDNRLKAVEDRVTTEVEIEPSYNSTNLITSGGVYSAISDFANDTETGSVAADGVLHNGYYWSRTVHKLDAGESITVLPTHMIESQVAWATNPLDPTAVVTGRFTYVSMENGATVLVGFLSSDSYSYTITKKKISISASVRQNLTEEQLAQARLNIGISSIDIQDGSVTTSKLANGAVTGAKIAEGTITSSNLAPDIELPYNITDGSITTAKLHDNAVTASKLDSSIANAVSAVSGKQDQLVSGTNIKTVNNQSLLGSGNIEISTTIADGSITCAKIANGAISSNKLDSSLASTISGKLDASSAFSGDYSDLTNKPTIPTVPTNVSAFTNDSGYLTNIPDNAVTTLKIADNAVTTQKLSSEVQTLLNTSGTPGNNSILTLSEEYTDNEIQTIHDDYLDNAAYLGNVDASVPDVYFNNNVVHTDVIQQLTEEQRDILKGNIFNRGAILNGSEPFIKYLKQNIVNGDNILSQSDFDSQNTVYIVDHDFIVSGTSLNPITIPNNCKLLFLGGSFSEGYININGAEILPTYQNIIESPNNTPTNIFGSPKLGSVYFNTVYNRPVFFNGTSWLFGDGSSTTTPFVHIDVPTYQNNPSIPVGYMFYNSNDNKLYVLTGISNSQYTWRTILCEQNSISS